MLGDLPDLRAPDSVMSLIVGIRGPPLGTLRAPMTTTWTRGP